MELKVIHAIKSNPLLYSYLRVNSSWYSVLNRDSSRLRDIEKEARHYYKMTFPDKIERFTNQMEMISTFMDVLR